MKLPPFITFQFEAGKAAPLSLHCQCEAGEAILPSTCNHTVAVLSMSASGGSGFTQPCTNNTGGLEQAE